MSAAPVSSPWAAAGKAYSAATVMEYALSLAGFAVVHLLAVISPGPSFALTVQTSARAGRGAGLIVAVALSLGALLWAAAAMFGLQALFARFEWLYVGLRLAGAAYLIYLAIMLWRAAARQGDEKPLETGPIRDPLRIFMHALLVQLANPKVMVFFGSIFVALLPPQAPIWVFAAVLGIVAVNEFWWYALVSLLFSAGPARGLYRRARAWIDRVTGSVLGLIGIRLALDW